MKSTIITILRIVALTVLLFILFAIAGSLITAPQDASQSNEGTAALMLLAACFLDALVITYIIRRSVITGWHLVFTLFIAFYGVMTFMSQIEAAVFPTHMSSEMVWRVFAMGIAITGPCSIIAVPVLGRWRAPAVDAAEYRGNFGVSEWVWRLGLIAIVYVAVYFAFGYFVAWQFEAVREYYGGAEPEGFVAHIWGIVVNSPWLIGFQLLRGVIWALLGLLIVRIVGERKLETPLAVGLAFAVLMNSQLLIPNPFMPEAVRMAHLVETASSNFLFGLFVGWLLLYGVNSRDQEVET